VDIRPSLQIQVMIKAMEQVVVPAVDPANKIASEQAGLVLATLKNLEQRLPMWRTYLRDEVSRLVALADDIVALDMGNSADLASLAEEGRAMFASASAEAVQLEAVAVNLRNAVGQKVGEQDQVHRSAIGKLIMDAAKIQLERERAWLLPFGFESDASSIPPIEQQLAAVS
jgi:hypothetical protein